MERTYMQTMQTMIISRTTATISPATAPAITPTIAVNKREILLTNQNDIHLLSDDCVDITMATLTLPTPCTVPADTVK